MAGRRIVRRRWLGWSSSTRDPRALVALGRMRERIQTCSKIPRTTTATKAALVAMLRKRCMDCSSA